MIQIFKNIAINVSASVILGIALLCSNGLYAQSDDVLLKAMQDELNRNMTELRLPNFEKPFFIMYGVLDQKTYSINAMLGSLAHSSETAQRFKSTVRVLVGGYEFNDESLEDNLFSNGSAIEIGLPIDDDYFGVRRSFWSTTDKVYRDAARHFEKHKETLKETQKALADIPHRSFAKVSPVVEITSLNPVTFNKSEWEGKARNLSALFLNHPTILNSTVALEFTAGHKYLVNSEGTVAKVPISLVTLAILGQAKDAKGEFAVSQIVHLATSPDQLPTEKELQGEIETMITNLEAQSTIPKLDEEYTGPVLLVGPVIAEVFSGLLFRSKESIVASDDIQKLTGFQYNEGLTSMEGKLGKSVFSESMSILAKPRMKNFNGTSLLGSYTIDDEGVVPAEELVIAEKGVLKNLINNRTITSPVQVANGFSSGPGVIEIRMAQKDSEKTLKEKLIARAKAEGLEYAIIVREAPAFNIGLVKVYKVSVATGKEELVKDAFLNPNAKALKRILGASDKYSAYNTGATGARTAGAGPGTGVTSFIVPNGILFEEMEVRPFSMPSLTEVEYVSNPLKK